MLDVTQASIETPDFIIDVPSGKVASIITYLEMRTPPAPSMMACDAAFHLRPVSHLEPEWYRKLFLAVGKDWLWDCRLRLSDQELTSLLDDPAIDLFALEHEAEDKGFLELDRGNFPEVHISFVGVVPNLLGKGAGRFLMAKALELAWAHHPDRVTLHTCTMDHPNALRLYINLGFVPYKRAIQIAADPRLEGILPPTAGPHIPAI